MTSRDFESKLRKMKAQGVIEPLFRAARLTNELALRRINQRPHSGPDIRAAHTALLPHIDLAGTRVTDLAQRLGVTKQAVSPLVDELEEMGALAKIPDPSDGRAKLVVFSEKGRGGLLEGMALLKELEEDFARAVGRKRISQLGRILQDLLAHLDALETENEATCDDGDGGGDDDHTKWKASLGPRRRARRQSRRSR